MLGKALIKIDMNAENNKFGKIEINGDLLKGNSY